MLNKFVHETKANVALMTGIALTPMLLAVGVGVDMSELYRAKTSFQAAVDSAALGAAKTLSRTGNATKAQAHGREIFDANIANLPRSTGVIAINTGNGDCTATGVTATATLRHPMFFDKLHKVFSDNGDAGHANLNSKATVMCGGDTVEIALVLDNSGSMGNNGKLDALKSASRNMVNTLKNSLGQQGRPKPLQFSVVPFAGLVNVGSNRSNANWMDRDGRASYHHEHLDWESNTSVTKVAGVYRDLTGNTVTRFSLFDNMGISWAGCVEQRPYPYHTNDATPDVNTPDTLFVPTFAPDEPDDYSGQQERVLEDASATQIYCNWWYNAPYQNYCYRWNDPHRSNNVYYGYYHPWRGYANRHGGEYDSAGVYIGGTTYTNGDTINEDRYLNNYLADEHNRTSDLTQVALQQYAAGHTGREADQYKRQRWTWKYFNNPNPRDVNNNTGGLPNVVGMQGGPNFYCTVEPLQDLKTNHNATLNKIDSMRAEGATNVQQGIAWGWRTLSPAKPFTKGRDYNVADNKKIMVVMTDGNNTMYPYGYFSTDNITKNPAMYSAQGYNGGEYENAALPKRLFEGFDAIANPSDDFDTYRKAMDEHMIETCTNAKAAGVQIYTIAFDVPQGADVRQTLETCSSKTSGGKPLYYSADNNAELIETFQDITEAISELSITF